MKFRLACLLGLLAFGPASRTLAQDPAVLVPDPPIQTVTGTVVSTTEGALVITTDVGIEQSFAADEQSTIAPGLAPGTQVTVRYRALPGGRFYAARVTPGDPGTTDEPGSTARPSTTPGEGAAPPPPASPPGASTPVQLSRAVPLLVVVALAMVAWGLAIRAVRSRSRTILALAEPFHESRPETSKEDAHGALRSTGPGL